MIALFSFNCRSGLRHADRFEAISFAVLRANFKQAVSQPYNLNQIEEAIKSVRFQILEDSIKAQLMELAQVTAKRME